MNKISNQLIKCDVYNCKYNNNNNAICNLKQIDISCTCTANTCSNKIETICNSFMKK